MLPILATNHIHAQHHFFTMPPQPPRPTLFPYTTLFRSPHPPSPATATRQPHTHPHRLDQPFGPMARRTRHPHPTTRSEEHTSELQSRGHLVCRLLLEKKNKEIKKKHNHK